MSSTPPATVYCQRCRKLVPLIECVVIDPEAHAGLPTDQLPDIIHTRKHRKCKARLYLPGRAPVEEITRLT